MSNGYVVPFIDDAEPGASSRRLYGSSLDYDETCDKLMRLRKSAVTWICALTRSKAVFG